jgi:hypothetical protein
LTMTLVIWRLLTVNIIKSKSFSYVNLTVDQGIALLINSHECQGRPVSVILPTPHTWGPWTPGASVLENALLSFR